MLNRTSIEEANKHLQALYSRVSQLESVVQEQHDALLAKDLFIQTKIEELSKQDFIIQELKHSIEEQDQELSQKNENIEYLEKDLSSKSMQISALKKESTALSDIMRLLPDLKSFMSKIDNIAKRVDDGYVDVSVSPCRSGDADNTDGGDVKTYTESGEDIHGNATEGSTTVGEMVRNFAKSDKSNKFSVSEYGEDDLNDMNEVTDIGRNTSTTKELYF